jgi:hypothetical protein
VAYGLYLMLRTSVDLISYKKKDVKNDWFDISIR